MASHHKFTTAELLYQSAERLGMQPAWMTNKGVFAVSINGQERYIKEAFSPLNSHTSAGLTKDKYLTRLIMQRHSMLNIPFARPKDMAQAEAFLALHGTIIAKPVRGFGSRDINIVDHPDQLQNLVIKKYILEKYISGQEWRYLVLNGEVIGVHRSDYGTSVEQTRSLERISFPPETWDKDLVASSLKIALILDLSFAAVDFMIDKTGTAYILEVNTAPGLKWFHAPTSGPAVDVAKMFLESISQK